MKKMSQAAKNFIGSVVRSGIFDSIGEGISIQDIRYTILYQNEAHKKMFGSHHGEPCYKAYVCREDVCDRCPLSKVFLKGEICEAELTVRTEKGTSFFATTSSPVKNKRGDIIAGIQVMRNITEQRREEDNLRESEERYRAIYKNAMDAICLIDPGSLKIVDCNQKAAELSGYSLKTLRGMNVRDLHPKEEQDIVTRIFEKTVEMGYLSGIYGVSQSRYDGIRVPVELNLTSTLIHGKNYIICSARDITRQKQAEERLLRDIIERKKIERPLSDSEGIFMEAFRVSPMGIAITGPEGKLVKANPALQNMLGYKEDELLRAFESVSHPEDMKETLILMNEMVEGKLKHYQVEKRYLRKDGSVIRAKHSSAAITDKNGKFKYAISFIEDITAREMAEKKAQAGRPLFKREMEERRSFKRYVAGEKSRATVDDSDIVGIKDIGLGGICLKTSRQFSIGSIHTLKFFPSMNGETISKGSVVWSSRSRKKLYDTGLKFIETSDELKKSIEAFILKHSGQ
jgi:PAS domain S-box-containing protein